MQTHRANVRLLLKSAIAAALVTLIAFAAGGQRTAVAMPAPGDIEWLEQLDGVAPDFETHDATIVVGGETYIAGSARGTFRGFPPDPITDNFVQKLDSSGNVIWMTPFGTSSFDEVQGMVVDAGGVSITGRTGGSFPGHTNAGSFDIFVARLDLSGNFLWIRQFGTSKNDIPAGLTTDGSSLFIAGTTSASLNGQPHFGTTDLFAMALDLAGNHQWTRQLGTNTADNGGEPAYHDGTVYVPISTRGSLFAGNAGDWDAGVLALDTSGATQWTTQFGTFDADIGNTAAAGPAGVFVSGWTEAALGGPLLGRRDAYTKQFSLTGTAGWAIQYGTSDFDHASHSTLSGNDILVVGDTFGSFPGFSNAGRNDVFATLITSAGVQSWVQQTGSALNDNPDSVSDDGGSIFVGGDAGGVLPGATASFGDAIFIQELDLSGNQLSVVQYGSTKPGTEFEGPIAATSDAVYVTGFVDGSVGGAASNGNSDGAVARFDFDGNLEWVRQVGTSEDDRIESVTTDATGVYVAGTTDGVFPGQASAGQRDLFARKLDHSGNTVWTIQLGSSSFDFGIAIDSGPTGLFLAWNDRSGAGGGEVTVDSVDPSTGSRSNFLTYGTAAFDYPEAIHVGAGELYVAGNTQGSFPGDTTPPGFSQDMFVSRISLGPSSGAEVWTSQIGTSQTNSARGIVESGGRVFLAGQTRGDLLGESNNGGDDAFVAALDSDGTPLWADLIGGFTTDWIDGIAADSSGVYVGGSIRGQIPGETDNGFWDAFVRRYSPGGAVIWSNQFGTPSSDRVGGLVLADGALFGSGATAGGIQPGTASGQWDMFGARFNIGDPQIPNEPPEAVISFPSSVGEGELINFDASGSTDIDMDPLTFEWDTDGDGQFDDATGAVLPITVFDGPAQVDVRLRVCDPIGECDTADASTTVNNVAPAPAISGPASIFRDTPTTYDGAWNDPAGTADEPYAWEWDLDGDSVADDSGIASDGDVIGGEVEFSLPGAYVISFSVTDEDGDTGTATTPVTVLNRAPDCSAASPSTASIWPPNHQMTDIDVVVDDADGDAVSILITSIFQDESVSTPQSGPKGPDAEGVGTSTASVRAERANGQKGDGRVYHIAFTASDAFNGSCSGEVTVGVPASVNGTAVDGGALFDSTIE